MADFTGYTGTTFGTYGVPLEATTAHDRVTVSLDNTRRAFALTSEKLAELTPNKTPFFTYMAKVRNEPTPDPVFKKMEIRAQWQRRYFTIVTLSSGNYSDVELHGDGYWTIRVALNYDTHGRKATSWAEAAHFIIPDQVVSIGPVTVKRFSGSTSPDITGTLHAVIRSVTHSSTYSTVTIIPLFMLTSTGTNTSVTWGVAPEEYGKLDAVVNPNSGFAMGQVIGTAFGEGTSYPKSWHDDMSTTEGYAQIFKTACPLMSGSSMATEYRGKPNEFVRIWDNKLNEHKMDIEHALLFGIGRVEVTSNQPVAATGAATRRYTWGVLPYIHNFGFKESNQASPNIINASSAGYDRFLDFMEEFTRPEDANDGSKLVLCSRKILKWFNQLGSSSFFHNTMDGIGDMGVASWDVNQINGEFGHSLLQVKTIFGDLKLMEHPLLRYNYSNYAIIVDMRDVKWRPLQGNGISRDTFVVTNVQEPGVDGRVDQIITEAGLEITLPERSAVLSFSNL